MAGHTRHAAAYAAAPTDATAAASMERDWQYRRLPERLRSVAFPPGATAQDTFAR